MEQQHINIPEIILEWTDWVNWEDIKVDARSGGIRIPNKKPGVYEVRFKDSEERLTIGETEDLRMRIRQGLVKGKSPHSSGKAIRAAVDTRTIQVRWALTDRPCAVEEELHKQYRDKFGALPLHTKHT